MTCMNVLRGLAGADTILIVKVCRPTTLEAGHHTIWPGEQRPHGPRISGAAWDAEPARRLTPVHLSI